MDKSLCEQCGLDYDPSLKAYPFLLPGKCGTCSIPIPLLLWCPVCHARHIDEEKNRPHHTHACQQCGMLWRPAVHFTRGVRFLPGGGCPST